MNISATDMEYFLRQISHGNANPLIINLDRSGIVVGRSTFNTLTRYLHVSRKHACFLKKIEGDVEEWYVKDLGSLNGIYVNSAPITNETKLEIGDHIGFGVQTLDPDGFVCTLSVRKVVIKKEFEIIDLSDDELPVIKKEPVDEVIPDNKPVTVSINSVSRSFPQASTSRSCEGFSGGNQPSISNGRLTISKPSILSSLKNDNADYFIKNIEAKDSVKTLCPNKMLNSESFYPSPIANKYNISAKSVFSRQSIDRQNSTDECVATKSPLSVQSCRSTDSVTNIGNSTTFSKPLNVLNGNSFILPTSLVQNEATNPVIQAKSINFEKVIASSEESTNASLVGNKSMNEHIISENLENPYEASTRFAKPLCVSSEHIFNTSVAGDKCTNSGVEIKSDKFGRVIESSGISNTSLLQNKSVDTEYLGISTTPAASFSSKPRSAAKFPGLRGLRDPERQIYNRKDDSLYNPCNLNIQQGCLSENVFNEKKSVISTSKSTLSAVFSSQENPDTSGIKMIKFEKGDDSSDCEILDLEDEKSNLSKVRNIASSNELQLNFISHVQSVNSTLTNAIVLDVMDVTENNNVSLPVLKSPESMEFEKMKNCRILLTRCDTDAFKWPADVRRPCGRLSNSNVKKIYKRVKLKRMKVMYISSSSESEEEEVALRHSVNKRGNFNSSGQITLSPLKELSSCLTFNAENTSVNEKIKNHVGLKRSHLDSSDNSDDLITSKPIVKVRPQASSFSRNETKKDSVVDNNIPHSDPCNSTTFNSKINSEIPTLTTSSNKQENWNNTKPMEYEDKNDNFDYSQVEDVIIISDDESYFDFNSSQVIKQEPLDENEEELAINSDDGIFKEMHDNDCVSKLFVTHENQGDVSRNSEGSFSGGMSESIDNIIKFVQDTDATSNQKKVDTNETSDHNDTYYDFFPMSQINNNSGEDSDSKSDNGKSTTNVDEDNIANNILKWSKAFTTPPVVNDENSNSSANSVIEPSKKIEGNSEQENKQSSLPKIMGLTKSTGRTLLTEPKRMERRPGRVRGREEWFEEKRLPSPMSRPLPKARKQKPTKEKVPRKSKGKSAMRISIEKNNPLSSYKIPKKLKPVQPAKKADQDLPVSRNLTPKDDKSKDQNVKKLPASKKKPAPVARRPDNYNSRSSFLLSDMQTDSVKKRPLPPKRVSERFAAKEYKPIHNKEPSAVPIQKPYNINSSNISQNQNPANLIRNNPVHANIKPTFFSSSTSRAHSQINSQVAVNSINMNHSGIQPKQLPNRNQQIAHSAPFNKDPSKICSVLPSPLSKDPRINRAFQRNALCASDNSRFPTEPFYSARALTGSNSVGTNHCQQPTTASIPSSISVYKLMPSMNKKPVVSTPHHQARTDIHDRNCKQVNFMGMVKRIVELNVKWLEEQKKTQRPPPEVSVGAVDLPLHFTSVDRYILSFYPMLMLEVWDEMYKGSKEIFNDERRVPNKFYFIIHTCESKSDMTEYKCEAVVNQLSFEPLEGKVIIMNIMYKNNKKCNPVLGYISWHRVEELKKRILTPEWDKVSKNWIENGKFWKFNVYVKTRQLAPMYNVVMKGNGICSIRSRVRLADSLQSLNLSPLCSSILIPDERTFHVNYPNVSPGRDFNHAQKMAIEGITAEVQKPTLEPKIILLQGPPGTGKTHTVIGILEKLIFTQGNKQKILMTAPSNAAIDEIGCRLIELNNRSSWRSQSIKFVRVGQPKQINPNMKSYTLDEKVTKMHKDCIKKKAKYNEDQLRKMQMEINLLMKQKTDYKNQQKINHLEEQQRMLKAELSLQNSDYGIQRKYKTCILQDSDIVLSTLGSLGQSILTSVFKSNSSSSFSCCIIDEATQCTETEVLQTLVFGINKLIMVGDHQQLPATVSSKLATACGYERSMFERFHLYFSKYSDKNPIFMLTEQFRMHSEICRFPSRKFYNNQLITCPVTDIRYGAFPVHPYIVYDILESQESNSSSSKTNCNEALVIVNICSLLLQLNSNTSIGIITPYQAQRTMYEKALHQNKMYRHIEVNTVDGFQGREKDVIIVSCVRANGPSGGIGFLSDKKRLNVAITRARQCLIICGHSNTLMQDPNWRDLIEDARDRQLCRPVATYKDIQLIFSTTMVKVK